VDERSHPLCIHSSPEGFGNRDLQCRNSGIKNEKVPAINIMLQRADGNRLFLYNFYIPKPSATVIFVTKHSMREELAIKIAIVIAENNNNNNNIRSRRYQLYYNILLLLLLLNTVVAQQLKNIIYLLFITFV